MPRLNFKVMQVEDDSVDIDLFQRALTRAQISIGLEIANDGEEALQQLARIAKDPDCDAPDLILLDLNLPKKNGHEFLLEIKKDAKLKVIPVIVLTNSISATDVVNCYAAGAACYVEKSADFDEFTSQIKKMFDFWKIVSTPRVTG